MSGLTVKELQDMAWLQALARHDDDRVKLASIDLWLDEIPGLRSQAADVLFDLDIRYSRTGFGGDDPDVAELKKKFSRALGLVMHRSVMAANAAGIDLEQAMLELLQGENP